MYDFASAGGYGLFIVDMVPSFHRRMLAWGARRIDDDTVQVTSTTRLEESHVGLER